MFRMQNTQVVSQLIKGDFPNYDQLIPQKHETRTIFDSRGTAPSHQDGGHIRQGRQQHHPAGNRTRRERTR